MKKIALLDTSIFSDNKGDDIIVQSVEKNIKHLLEGNFVMHIPTHSPAYHAYQTFKKNDNLKKRLEEFDLKFVCGTNLLWSDMLSRKPLWDINILNSKYLCGSILVGVGCPNNDINVNSYTKKLYRQVLSHDYIHSVRDSKTEHMMKDMGFKVINTGCVTTWSLTPEHCAEIPTIKSSEVIFTLTDYCKDVVNDQKLINILNDNYSKVYFWVQGLHDYEYLCSLKNTENIEVVNPTLDSFEYILTKDIDYIGTRLHAGIKALQYKRRSIIVAVDSRARNINKDINLNCVERNEIDSIVERINSNWKTDIKINQGAINQWLSQFEIYK
ncbi:hypothetical protein GCM10008908_07860 [Clostridium subterminale]|uniref:Polysaccharide pyruvyl transferase domain-containing protein n=1 Tax=Clostridium subterminale TaxID=1550 RepID=A0ABN1KJC2_CLOSU